MTRSELKAIWKEEERRAQVHGWDFSPISGRYEEERDLPWNYRAVLRAYLTDQAMLLDYDTGGGEFLLSLRHPCDRTAATEGYPPNARLCRERLVPLGISFRECSDPAAIPYPDESFDIIANRHGSFHPGELFRLLKTGGVFITEQVGADNDRDLVERVLPGLEKPYPHLYLARQRRVFEEAGFHILRAEEAYRPILFYDVGAFVWFARVIEWEFPGFCVDRCFDRLWALQEEVEKNGRIQGTIHRFLLVAEKAALPGRSHKI